MPRRSRRRFLLTTGVILAGGFTATHSTAEGVNRQRLTQAADRGRRFLTSLYDPAVGLLPEFRGSNVYWLYLDN